MNTKVTDDADLEIGADAIARRIFGGKLNQRQIYRLAERGDGWPFFRLGGSSPRARAPCWPRWRGASAPARRRASTMAPDEGEEGERRLAPTHRQTKLNSSSIVERIDQPRNRNPRRPARFFITSRLTA